MRERRIERMRGWFKFTNLELIVITFMIIFGILTHWILGIFMLGIGILIHTLSWLVTRKDAEDNKTVQEESE